MSKFWQNVTVALIGAAATVAAALIGLAVHKSKEVHYTAQVFRNDPQQEPIAQAQVQIGVGTSIQTKFTDKDGIATFVYTPTDSSGSGNVVVRASGFATEEQPIPQGDERRTFRLEPLPGQGTPKSSVHPKAAQLLPHAQLLPYTRDTVLGPVPSGSKNEYSDWYVMAAEAPAPGYQFDLGNSHYEVSGDRHCPGGGWLLCEWGVRDGQHLQFRFRLQGHDEWPAPGVGFSVGKLHAAYVPIVK